MSEGDASILLRQKEDYDGAEPAASSIAAANLFQLAALSSADQCRKWVANTFRSTSVSRIIYCNAEEEDATVFTKEIEHRTIRHIS